MGIAPMAEEHKMNCEICILWLGFFVSFGIMFIFAFAGYLGWKQYKDYLRRVK